MTSSTATRGTTDRDTDRTSDAFIRQVAHDLRASLNVVVSWAELVKAGQLPPEDVSRAGDTIVRHARHLSERLGVALDLWRLDSGLLDAVPRAARWARSSVPRSMTPAGISKAVV